MGTCERMLRVDKPADAVWAWMSKPRNLLSINIFHAEVHSDDDELREGAVIDVDHDFFGAVKQERQVKILEVKPYFVRFGEYKKPGLPGKDPFPHNQSFRVVPVDDESSIIVNRVSGNYVFPGRDILGVGDRLFDRYIPVILDDDNQVIAIGCGGMEPSKLNVPKGLLLYPLWVGSTRWLKKSTRLDVINRSRERAEARRAEQAAAERERVEATAG
jgi:hypothetical protein